MRQELDRLIDEMLSKGIKYDDARRIVERRFISRALTRTRGSLGRTAELLGMHRNTLSRKLAAYRLKRSA